MKNILLPTDFSDNAYNAIRYAMQFFENEICTFYLLNTFTPTAYRPGYFVESPIPYDLESIATMNAKKKMEQIETKIKKEFKNPDHCFVKIVAFNTLVSEIENCVAKYAIDMIVMGTKGATGAKEIFIGTHTVYTIKKAKCPVLVIPEKFTYEAPKEILFPTDYQLDETNPFLPLIKDLCTTHISRLHILNAYYGVPLDAYQEEIKAYLDAYFKENAHAFHHADGVDVIEAIEAFQKNNKVNLLVMVHNRHSFFDNLLFKPVINQIAYHANIPFLVLPSAKIMPSSKQRTHEMNITKI